jgi:hypothetical protein
VDKYFRKLHEDRSPPGFERIIWRRLPIAFFASVFLPACLSASMRLLPPDGTADEVAKTITKVDFFAIGLGVTSSIAVFTVAIGCIVVMIMKGPAYVADAYELNAADEPAPREQSTESSIR